jgi:hypothetical protein
MSMNRIDQYPGRGSANLCRARKKPVDVTATTASQLITPTVRTHGVDPDYITMRPAIATASARHPTRRLHAVRGAVDPAGQSDRIARRSERVAAVDHDRRGPPEPGPGCT